MTLFFHAGTTGEHYARTDAGELIGPYDTSEECERERVAANDEIPACMRPGFDPESIGTLGRWSNDA